MKKKTIILLTIASLFLLLVGCGRANKNDGKKIDIDQMVKDNAKKKSQSKSKDKKPIKWTSEKNAQLGKFMITWGQVMNQKYDGFNQQNNVSFYGIRYPEQFADNNIKVNDQKATLGWSDTGLRTDVDYNVVAIYADTLTNHNMDQHLYLFTVCKGKPYVLITQQNQGMPDGDIHFNETQNEALKTGFKQIFNTGKFKKLSSSQNQQSGNNFPADMQGQWYGNDEEGFGEEIKTMDIKNNVMSFDSFTFEAHNIKERTKQDEAAIMDESLQEDQKKNWDIISSINKDGRQWINLTGWYQSAGAGSWYSVKIRNLDGKDVPVMSTAGGADMHVTGHYYPTKELAEKYQDSKYPDENSGF